MRIIFLIVLLGASVFYSYIAFVDLPFLTRTGRLGAGFFPRLIGSLGILFSLWALADALRQRGQDQEDAEQWRQGATLIALALFYAVMLRLFGGFFASVIFLAAALSVLNRGRLLVNVGVALIVPAVVYLLFDRVLNASMPTGLISLPL